MDRKTVVVVGLGAVGGQAALHLARHGARVVGFDRHTPPHPFGSSHGATRVIREAYFEGPGYVPLVRRAYRLWDALGADLGAPVLRRCAGVHLGPPDGVVVPGIRAAASAWDIDVAEHDAASLARAAPAFRLPDGMVALIEPGAGVLAAEDAVGGVLGLARAAGADLRFGVSVEAIEPVRDGDGVRVSLAGGAKVEADAVVVAAGAWTGELLPALAPSLRVERQVLVWFAPGALTPDGVWFCEHAPGRFVYGFPPDPFGRVKVARHHDGPLVDPDTVDRTVGPSDLAPVRALVDRLFATPPGAVADAAVCLYTNTPDEHFAFGPLPDAPAVVVASACSGHGFKFAPAVGEALAHQALGVAPPVDVSAFGVERLLR